MISATRFLLVLAAVMNAAVLPGGAPPSHLRDVSVSLLALRIAPEERVVGYHFKVTSGRTARVSDVPIGWSISVNNDPSWNTNIDASVIVAAAAVDASYFKDFVILEKYEGSEIPFEVKGAVSVSRDFSKVRKIQVEMKDFTVKDMTGQAKRLP